MVLGMEQDEPPTQQTGSFSAEEDEKIRSWRGAPRVIAQELGRSAAAVRNRRWYLGLGSSTSRPWAEQEIALLRAAYGSRESSVRLTSIAKRLHRDKSNVCRKARQLGLTNQNRPKDAQLTFFQTWGRARQFESEDERRRAVSAQRKKWIAEHGHPRGALGMRHTDETRRVISERSRAAWNRSDSGLWNPALRQRRSDQMMERIRSGVMSRGGFAFSRARAGRREDLGGRYFRSRWEANYARYLKWLVERGDIRAWDYESRRFEFEKVNRGTRSYMPDFYVEHNNGGHEWHEVKGWMDQKSAVRLKRMSQNYPDEVVRVIDGRWFAAAIKGGLDALIPNWEKQGT